LRIAIERNVDPEALRITKEAEKSEREVLARIARIGDGDGCV